MQKTHKPYRFILSGGGTGGHIFPAIAIAQALKSLCGEEQSDFLFIGARGKLETILVPKAGFSIKTLNVIGMPRGKNVIRLVHFAIKMLLALTKVRSIIKKFKPAAIIGLGGYASFPTLYIAQKMGYPNFIHEQNALSGVVNKTLATKTNLFFGGYKILEQKLPSCKFLYTGNPLRTEFKTITPIDKEEVLKNWTLSTTKKTLLITGGSQGAHNMNLEILSVIDEILKLDVQIIWQTGTFSLREVQKEFQPNEKKGYITPFIESMSHAYAVADIIIARAGALSIAELSTVGKPVILIPLPTAAENHQFYNAQVLAQKDATILIKEKKIRTDLVSCLNQFIVNPSKAEALGNNIKQFAMPDADKMIAREIIKEIDRCST